MKTPNNPETRNSNMADPTLVGKSRELLLALRRDQALPADEGVS